MKDFKNPHLEIGLDFYNACIAIQFPLNWLIGQRPVQV